MTLYAFLLHTFNVLRDSVHSLHTNLNTEIQYMQ